MWENWQSLTEQRSWIKMKPFLICAPLRSTHSMYLLYMWVIWVSYLNCLFIDSTFFLGSCWFFFFFLTSLSAKYCKNYPVINNFTIYLPSSNILTQLLFLTIILKLMVRNSSKITSSVYVLRDSLMLFNSPLLNSLLLVHMAWFCVIFSLLVLCGLWLLYFTLKHWIFQGVVN